MKKKNKHDARAALTTLGGTAGEKVLPYKHVHLPLFANPFSRRHTQMEPQRHIALAVTLNLVSKLRHTHYFKQGPPS